MRLSFLLLFFTSTISMSVFGQKFSKTKTNVVSSVKTKEPLMSQITGFGEWKIGRSTSQQVRDYASSVGVAIKASTSIKLDNKFDFVTKKTTDLILLLDPTSGYDKYSVDGVSAYFLNYLDVAGVGMADVKLYFYYDTLYSIEISQLTNEVQKALDAKYGKGRTTIITEKNITCRNSYQTFEEKELAFSIDWGNVGDIIYPHLIFTVFFDSNCKKLTWQSLTLKNTAMSERISNLSKEKGKAIKENFELQEKKKLEKF